MLISDWSSDVCSSDLADAFEKLAVERLLNRANRDVAEVYARLATMSCKFATCLKCRCRPSRCHGSKRTIHGESLRPACASCGTTRRKGRIGSYGSSMISAHYGNSRHGDARASEG